MSGSNWAHACPAALPAGIPGNGEVIDGAMQQAPQPSRQVKADWHVMVKISAATAEKQHSKPIRPKKAAIVPQAGAST